MRNFKVKDIRTRKFEKPTTIFICDPCYIFDYTKPGLDEEWQAFVEKMFPEGSKTTKVNRLNIAEAGTLEIAGATMLYTSTAYGDGQYSVQAPGETAHYDGIMVDAGMICVISEESAMRINPEFNHKKAVSMGAVVYNFQGEVEATGKGFTGDLTVDTEDESEDQEDEDDL